ncbi:MAG: hypothetical protein QMD50_00460 [Patescibacteria group bacterium]|nr:hypothetical protein [Patescibacteria group bacterium]
MKFISIIIISVLVGFFGLSSSILAQTESQGEIIFTWQAKNFYPANFEGKALPTQNSNIDTALELLKDNKLQDLSNAAITWFLDGKIFKKGIGFKEASFIANRPASDSHFIKVTIELQNDFYENSLRLYVFNPKIAILTKPFSRYTIPANAEFSLSAVPFFFNVGSFQDLLFFWQIGSEKTSGSNALSLIFQKTEKTIDVSVAIQNQKNILETTKELVYLNIKSR